MISVCVQRKPCWPPKTNRNSPTSGAGWVRFGVQPDSLEKSAAWTGSCRPGSYIQDPSNAFSKTKGRKKTKKRGRGGCKTWLSSVNIKNLITCIAYLETLCSLSFLALEMVVCSLPLMFPNIKLTKYQTLCVQCDDIQYQFNKLLWRLECWGLQTVNAWFLIP